MTEVVAGSCQVHASYALAIQTDTLLEADLIEG